MSKYDIAVADCYSRAYAAVLARGGGAEQAASQARLAVTHFKQQFPRNSFEGEPY